jgi:hypothetical protein
MHDNGDRHRETIPHARRERRFTMLKHLEYPRIKDVPGTVVKISSDARRYNAFPKVIRTSDTSTDPRGALLATWYSGNAHVDTDGDGQIWGAISADEGATWSAPLLVHDDPALDYRNVGIARAPDSTLILFFAKAKVEPGKLTREDLGYISSVDHGRTWGAYTSLISNTNSIVPGAANGHHVNTINAGTGIEASEAEPQRFTNSRLLDLYNS